jgi:hypothetical protein
MARKCHILLQPIREKEEENLVSEEKKKINYHRIPTTTHQLVYTIA